MTSESAKPVIESELENEYSDELNNYSNGISSFVKSLYADDIEKMEEMHKTNNELMEEVEEECDIAKASMENVILSD